MSPLVTEKKMISVAELLLMYFEPAEEKVFNGIQDSYYKKNDNILTPNPDVKIDKCELSHFKGKLFMHSPKQLEDF